MCSALKVKLSNLCSQVESGERQLNKTNYVQYIKRQLYVDISVSLGVVKTRRSKVMSSRAIDIVEYISETVTFGSKMSIKKVGKTE